MNKISWEEVEKDLALYLTSPHSFQRAVGEIAQLPPGEREGAFSRLMDGKLRAKLNKCAQADQNQWLVYSGLEEVLSLTAEQAYGNQLGEPFDGAKTNREWFNSRNYGINLIKAIKQLGIEKVIKQI